MVGCSVHRIEKSPRGSSCRTSAGSQARASWMGELGHGKPQDQGQQRLPKLLNCAPTFRVIGGKYKVGRLLFS